MKILHTSDWHLGKIFHEFSFIDDQKEMLNQLLQELKNAEENNNPYDALFVAGDIYDRQIPPVEAVNLFSSFLFQVRNQFPKLELFFIAGNHDSAARLAFAKEILKNEKIHICSDTKTFCKPVILSNEKESVDYDGCRSGMCIMCKGNAGVGHNRSRAAEPDDKTCRRVSRRAHPGSSPDPNERISHRGN